MPEINERLGETPWREGGVRWALLPSGSGTAVELRSLPEPKPFALIVEDEHDPTDTYGEALRFLERRALRGANGRDAIRHAEDDPIILDYLTPGVHGRDLCRRLRANPETGQVPILVVTASPQDHPESMCADAVLTKPRPLPTLLAASRLLLCRVLRAAVSRPPAPPTA